MKYILLILSLLMIAPMSAKPQIQSGRGVSAVKACVAAYCLYHTAKSSWVNLRAFVDSFNRDQIAYDTKAGQIIRAGALGYCSYHLAEYALDHAQHALALD